MQKFSCIKMQMHCSNCVINNQINGYLSLQKINIFYETL